MINPFNHLQGPSFQLKKKAEEFLCSYNEEYINGLCLFKLKDQCIFPPYMFKESFLQIITPNRWWRLIEQKQSKICDKTKKLPNGFCQFISCLHCCPASSGSIERVFSTFGLLWSSMRNALGSDRVQKLVTVYRHYSL